jgi:hypothetical protein
VHVTTTVGDAGSHSISADSKIARLPYDPLSEWNSSECRVCSQEKGRDTNRGEAQSAESSSGG